MVKQLKPNQWIYYFDLYESDYERFIIEYQLFKSRPFKGIIRSYFLKRYCCYRASNNNPAILQRKISKPYQRQKEQIMKVKTIDPSHLNDEDLAKIINHYYEIINNNPSEYEKFKTIIKDSQSSTRKWDATGFVSKSTVCRIKANLTSKVKDQSAYYQALKSIVTKYKHKIGRQIVTQYLKMDYGIMRSERQVGRDLKTLGYQCLVRQKSSRKKEQKNTSIQISNIVNRDYHNRFHLQQIVATDVTYLKAPKDVNQNNIYLSVAIDHRTKAILNFNLSIYNDVNCVMKHINKLDLPVGTIIHSDHGLQYSSQAFQNLCKIKGWIQSMSRVGNCLDNREVEHWFGIFKSEFFNLINSKDWTLKELEIKIANYIKYYNEQRIQKQLNWMSPIQYQNALKSAIIN